MPEQPSQINAKSTASPAESTIVQPMLRVQMRNIGMRLW